MRHSGISFRRENRGQLTRDEYLARWTAARGQVSESFLHLRKSEKRQEVILGTAAARESSDANVGTRSLCPKLASVLRTP
jgi:hypothetical protein